MLLAGSLVLFVAGKGNINPLLAVRSLRPVRQDPVAHRILNGSLNMVI